MIESFLSTITEEDVDEDKIKIITDYLFDIELFFASIQFHS